MQAKKEAIEEERPSQEISVHRQDSISDNEKNQVFIV